MTNSSVSPSSVPVKHPKDAHAKALSLNLDPSTYGAFAEIGGGQEVARWFLAVGAASGTVAKTMSAYDKKVSDDIYGAGTRYVSRERLLAMIDREYMLLIDRLGEARGSTTRFFAFADTVATRNYQGTNDQHGWIGIRFQAAPGSEPSQILLHINLCDPTAQLQQEAIGILGVNLIYAAFHQRSGPDDCLPGLFDALTIDRIEIDVLELSGPAFADQHQHAWCLELLRRGMAHAIIFNSQGQVVEPSSLLRKRPLLVMRGSFSHPEHLDSHLFTAAREQLLAEGTPLEREPAALCELTVRHVSGSETLTPETLERVRKLTLHGSVLITDFPETYLLSRYLRRHSTEPVRFILGVSAAAKTLREEFYKDLPGTLLEGIGRLLSTNVKLYVAPMARDAFEAALGTTQRTLAVRDSATDVVTLDDLVPAAPAVHLMNYLLASGRIVALKEIAATSETLTR